MTLARNIAAYLGSTAVRSSWGRGITCTLTTSPTLRAAAAPASTAAFTLATSPETNAVHNALPTFFQPTNSTFAALSMASVAHTSATSPLVSIIPMLGISFSPLLQHSFNQSVVRPRDDVRRYQFARTLRRLRAGVNRRSHASDISADHSSDIAAADLHQAYQIHTGSL